jgi:purine nucleoside phosphorylase
MTRLYRGKLLDDQTPAEKLRPHLVPMRADSQAAARLGLKWVLVIVAIGVVIWAWRLL